MDIFFIDFIIVFVFIIVTTALMGVLTSSFFKLFFGGKRRNEYRIQMESVQSGWKKVGGKETTHK